MKNASKVWLVSWREFVDEEGSRDKGMQYWFTGRQEAENYAVSLLDQHQAGTIALSVRPTVARGPR